MPTVGFEPTISAGERPQTYALDLAANGTGTVPQLAEGIMADLWRDFWICENETSQQKAQLHDRYIMMMIYFTKKKWISLKLSSVRKDSKYNM
jgi:hypothetical protein